MKEAESYEIPWPYDRISEWGPISWVSGKWMLTGLSLGYDGYNELIDKHLEFILLHFGAPKWLVPLSSVRTTPPSKLKNLASVPNQFGGEFSFQKFINTLFH